MGRMPSRVPLVVQDKGSVAHLVDARVLGQRSTSDAACALDDVQDTWRQACLQRQLADAQRAERRLLRHLPAQKFQSWEGSKLGTWLSSQTARE